MKHNVRSLLLVVAVCFVVTKLNAQSSNPGYRDIALAFFRNYKKDDHHFLKISHRKDGWHVGKVKYDSIDQVLDDQLFWSNSKRVYEPLSWEMINVADSIAQMAVDDHLLSVDWNSQEYDFERMPYFGYAGWNWDVIDLLENRLNKTDLELEVLGRAYSNYASGFLYDQYGDFFENNDPDRKRLSDDELVPYSRIRKFKLYQTRAINTYQRLKEQNPAYQTKVGEIGIKLYNEYVYSYSSINMAGDSSSAREYLRELNYPDSLIKQSKVFLDGVPLNGILLTSGDNDTYPLVYLQLVKNYRPDVLILNTSLLGFRRYVSMYKKMYPDLISVEDSFFMTANFDYFLYAGEENNEEEIAAGSFIESILRDSVNPHQEITLYKGLPLKKYYSKKVYFNGKKKKYISLGSYIFMSDLFIIDIVKNLLPNRSVIFTYKNELFDPILERENMVYKIVL